MSRSAARCGRTTRLTAPSSSWPAAAPKRFASGCSQSTLRRGEAGAQVRLGQLDSSTGGAGAMNLELFLQIGRAYAGGQPG